MKIVWVLPRIPYPTSDGGATCMFHTLRTLSEYNHDICICGYESNLHPQEKEKVSSFGTLLTLPGNFRPYSTWDALKFSFLRKPVTVFQKYDEQILAQQFEQIGEDPDVIFFEGIQVSKHIDIAKTYFPKSKIIVREHNVEFEVTKSIASTIKNPFKRLFYSDQSNLLKKFELEALSKADLVVTITDGDKKKLLQCNSYLNIETIPAGTLLPEQLNLKRSDRKLLTISSWKWEPNLFGLTWFLDNVWDDLVNQFPDLELHIAGSSLPEKVYSDKHNVIYHGFVEDLEPLKQSSTLFIAPLFSGSGIKIKVLEALSSRIPVLTTEIGAAGVGLLEEQSVMHFEDKKTLITQIEKLLDDPVQRESIGSNGFNHVKEHFTWDQIGNRLNTVIQSLVHS